MSVDRKVGLFLLGIGIFSLLTLVLRQIAANYSFYRIMTHPSVYSMGIGIVVISISTFLLPPGFNKALQVIVMFSIGVYSSIDDFQSWYGMGLIAISIILAFKYGYFKEYLIFKVLLLGLAIVVLVEMSTSVGEDRELKLFGLEALIFYSFFMGIVFICYFDETKQADSQISSLKKKRQDLEWQLVVLTEQIQEVEETRVPFDFSKADLTRAELEVLECLVKHRSSNVEIAKMLEKSELTVRAQLKSIYRKLSIKGRYEAIELCRYNFDPITQD